MADLTEYPPNLTPRDALVVRAEANAEPQHAVVPYSAEDLARPAMGPANPFRPADGTVVGAKRKASGVLTGTATEIHISEYTFRAKHRAVEAREGGGPGRTGREIKEASAAVRRAREAKGSATVVEGEGSYVGPWARFGARGGAREDDYEVVEGELGSDDEYEVVYEDEDDEEEAGGGAEVVASGTEVAAPAAALARRKEAEELGAETTTFHGSEERDYQGRTYMHVPQDLDVDLRKEVGSITNYIPRKLVHAWKSPSGKAVTSLRLFPRSGHLVLGGYADNTVRLWDFYHDRELLRSFSGHLKAITDLAFDRDGRRFVSGSHDRTMKVWDTESGRCLARFSNGKTPHCLVFNPTPEHAHTFLAGMSDANILCFDTRAGNEPVQEYNHHLAAINTITFVEDGGTFMTTSDDKSIRCWNWDVPVRIPPYSFFFVMCVCVCVCVLSPSGCYPS